MMLINWDARGLTLGHAVKLIDRYGGYIDGDTRTVVLEGVDG